ncbi:N6-mAMP deaminase isoform X1 [Rosa chinensis]|uniref:N6-mAMP deaminase isoform X1 n=1 Tax=Rosa chinensis TaxID=74649 RepID=UPI001AD8FF35|nr:N6-mAMP deaminase isoform X1 [Rosa chinensis]
MTMKPSVSCSPPASSTASLQSILPSSLLPLPELLQSISSIKADYIARQQCKASSSPLVLCTDDSGVFSTSTSNEYNLAASAFGLGRREIFQLTRNSCKFIFADDGVKRELKEIFSSPEQKLDQSFEFRGICKNADHFISCIINCY